MAQAATQIITPSPQNSTIAFHGTEFDVVPRNNQPWLRATQIGLALGYSIDNQAIQKIYDRNKDEFTAKETALVTLSTNGGKQKVRIFSPRGAWLIGMFARTKTAKEFRRWVLDVLEEQQPKTTMVKSHTRRLPDPKPEVEPRGPATGLPYGRYLITVDLEGRIVPIETETVARGTHIMDTDKLYYLQKAIAQIIPRQLSGV